MSSTVAFALNCRSGRSGKPQHLGQQRYIQRIMGAYRAEIEGPSAPSVPDPSLPPPVCVPDVVGDTHTLRPALVGGQGEPLALSYEQDRERVSGFLCARPFAWPP